MSKSFKLHLLACAACLAGAPAFAQVAPVPAAGSTTVETIIVTASRRSESVQNVPGAVTALSGSQMAAQHANDFADFAKSVPGLSFIAGGATSNLIAIRGVTTGGTQLGSGIGLYFDDVPIGASTQFGLGFQSFNFNVFDLDRVEVLNGPQGTLYGANALGGAIRYIPEKPRMNTYAARGEVEGSNTDHGGWNDILRGMVNVPIGANVALRLDGIQQYESGFTQDPTHNRHDVGSGRTWGGRAQLLAQLTPDLSVRLTAFSQKINGEGADVALRDPTTHLPVGGSDYDQSYALAQPSFTSVTVYSGVVNWNLHFANLTSITAWQKTHGVYQADDTTFYDDAFGLYDYLFGSYGIHDDPFGPYDLYVNTSTRKFTQEIRLTSPDNQHFEWVVGGYFDHESTDELVDLLDSSTPSGEIPAGYTGAGTLPFYGHLPSTYREFAGYADATYFFTPNFDLTLGVRYSNQHQDYQSNIQSVLVPNAVAPTPNVLYHYQSSSNQGVATFLINPRFHITSDVMVYARISSGFRPGGPNFVLPGSALPPTFQPDKLWNYEVGEKSTLFDGRATLDADIYDIEWKSLQATENVEGINQLVNAGNARIQGVEAAFRYRVLPGLTVGGSGAYTDARLVTTSPVLGVDYTGARLPLSPRYNFALDANYRFEIGNGYSAAVDVNDAWVGDRTYGYFASASTPQYVMPAYNTVNLSLAFMMPHHLELDVYLKNVFNAEGQISANTLNNVFGPNAPVPVELSQPRTVGVVLKAAFGG